MSGGEPSSIKRTAVCAARVPDLSWLLQHRTYRISRGRVCSLAKDRFLFSRIEVTVLYEALYRKYRPKTFDDVVGQETITETLKNQVRTGRLSHAYLFIGTRGTGKTTCARILAKAVNCEHPVNGNPCNECPSCRGIEDGTVLDVVELDAASNNGVDDVRMLRDEAVFSPTTVRKRVYIIDEVHMLSKPAFNALLKILEEPPAHLMFILATTELNKVLPTILSRCQRHSFRRLDAATIAARLSYVASCEGIRLDPKAAELLGRLADGGMRDGLSLLDQCSGAELVDDAAVLNAMGLAGSFRTRELAETLLRHDVSGALNQYGSLWRDGKDPAGLLGELSGYFRDALLFRLAPDGGKELLSGGYSEDALRTLDASDAQILWILNTLQKHQSAMASVSNPRLQGELCLIELCGTVQLGAEKTVSFVKPAQEKAVPCAEPTPPMERAFVPAPKPTTASPIKEDPPAEPARPAPAPEPASSAGSTDSFDLWPAILRELQKVLLKGHYIVLSDPALVSGSFSDGELVLQVQPGFETDMVTQPDTINKIRQCAARLAGQPVVVRTEAKTNGSGTLNEDKLSALEKFGNVTFR